MSSKKCILDAIRSAKGPLLDIPESMQVPFVHTYQVEDFMRVLNAIGGQAKRCTQDQLESFLLDLSVTPSKLGDLRGLDSASWNAWKEKTILELSEIDTIIIEASLGVAENGAVWVSDQDLPQRILPFVCQHVVVCLKESNLVSNMHEAYAALNEFRGGYGVFIAGPSKTADIEQSLVIGAHGPRSLIVYLVA
jgi:L-lactate dehydrogenase complex protein LldG